MSWVYGMTATSALDSRADLRRPDAIPCTFLNQPQQVAYFRAFTDDSLGSIAFMDIAERYLRRAAGGAEWSSEGWHDAPVFIGSSFYTIAEYGSRRRAGNADIGEHNPLYLTEDLRERSDNRQIFSLVTVYTSSAYALIQADSCLRGGAGHAFILGIEDPNRLALLHFHSLNLFTERYRPFGGNDLILDEGIAMLALSVIPPDCIGRLKLAGHATNTDNDLVQSSNKTLEQVIRRALNAAATLPESIATIKTHGIGTADSDTAELVTLENVFGTLPPLMAFKAQVGHALGAITTLKTVLPLPIPKQGDGTNY